MTTENLTMDCNICATTINVEDVRINDADETICEACETRFANPQMNGDPNIDFSTHPTTTSKGKIRIEIKDSTGKTVGCLKPSGSRFRAVSYRSTGRQSLGSYGSLRQGADAILADMTGR